MEVAVGSLFIECNHLGGVAADIAAFERQGLYRGEEFLGRNTGTLGGMLTTCKQRNATVRPLVAANACPAGPVTQECYDTLKNELVDGLSPDVDGVILALHGAAAVEETGDLEGDLLATVRMRVGPSVPVVATLDLHAHVTAAMVDNADALVAWETYPHRDAYETGERAATLLLNTIARECRPAMAMAKVPVVVGGINGSTDGDTPFAEVMRFAKSIEAHPDVLSTSAFLVHPYLNFPNMGGGGLVITDGDLDQAELLATGIANAFWARRFDLEPTVFTPEEAITKGVGIEGGPVLLVETADCCGGGAAGDSVATLRALLDAKLGVKCIVPVVDPQAAARCHEAGLHHEVDVRLGHQLDSQWGHPLSLRGRVERLTDGLFRYDGGIFTGQTVTMGPTAVLQVDSIEILIASNSTYDWRDEQFRSAQLDVTDAKFVVVKNPMNFLLAFGSLAREAFVLDTPGPTPATVRHVEFDQWRRPYFPVDPHISDLSPTVLRHDLEN